MSFKIYHQLGFRYMWNLDSIAEDHSGDGVILAPRHMSRDIIENLPESIKQNSIFDPQFFIPNTPKGNLSSYTFFPENLAQGFVTQDYSIDVAALSAQDCVKFQIANNFFALVIPTRYVEGTPSDYIQQQNELFVKPFLKAIKDSNTKKPVLLQLIVNDLMLMDPEYIADLLNWVTSLEVSGIYLITRLNSISKQIKDSEYLLSVLDFIDALKLNSLNVVLGYLNTEAVLLSLASPDILTIGSYENTRSFDIRAFEDNENQDQRGPSARLFMSRLLQWMESTYLGALRRSYPNVDLLFDINRYQAEMFDPTYRWHFTKPQLYKHHFMVMYNELSAISQLEGINRFNFVRNLIQNAINLYSDLSNRGIVFDANSDGSHLSIWLTVANLYAKKKGWLQ